MRYQVLGRTGLVVSELIFGAGNLGTRWGYGAEPEEARSMMRGYVDAGGNCFDSADGYQFGQSETLIQEFLGAHRDEFILASKYTAGLNAGDGFGVTGNSRKTMVQSVEGSLRRLGTDHIDLYWAHYPDGRTPIEEIARGFEDLTRAGKIVYAGLSNFPAWRVARAATTAELRGWAPITAIQLEYSLVERTADRELLPMAQGLCLGAAVWGVLGGGLLSGKYRRGEQGRADTFKFFVHAEDSRQKAAILDAVLKIAGECEATPGQVSIAWARTRGVLPIIGPRTRAQLDENLGATSIALNADQLQRLDAVSAVPLGAPHEMLASESARKRDSDPRLQKLQAPSVPIP